ncbi:cell envelope integrity protein CreD [Pontiellaceae bacterium B12219]|nr:cell envelope integrity protein CreD [Pontiellaceae bacterium B12219]
MRKNIVWKVLVLGFVSVAMLIALSSIDNLARERKARALSVQRDIASSYAGEQQIIGPVFTVRYREFWTESAYNKETDTWYEKPLQDIKMLNVYPETFSYDGDMQVQERYRGIFKAHVFQTAGTVSGAVVFPEIEMLGTREGVRIELVSANACILMSDLRGFTRVPVFKFGEENLEVVPGSDLDAIGNGVHAKLPDPGSLFGNRFEFELPLDVHGMGNLTFVPVGDDNFIQLSSAWPHPSFIGDFLATDRTVSEAGFTAEWNVNGLACSAQQHISRVRKGPIQELGVSLVDPVNVYSMTDRALKYGFLFIFITFTAFFMFETISGLQIHPIQYGFVGLAQAIFFLLLLSLSEHVGFGGSYFMAAGATIVLITFYLCHVLKGAMRGMSFGGLLALLYGVLFVLLKSEDHALVAGSALVFGLMALAMLLTRKVDWYAIGAKHQGTAV